MNTPGLLETTEPAKALCLLSGGLDSQLAVCLLKAQDIRVHCVVFESPFFDATRAKRAAESLGATLHVRDFSSDIISLVQNPKHGFGSNMNPCIDCHALMLKRAGEMMKDGPYDFIATGEVLQQRPMSQNPRALATVVMEAGLDGYVLRPLSAGLLPETEPERLGLVDRARLLSISGRSREHQFRLAEHYGLKDFPTPSGGCRLTDPNYSSRLHDLIRNEGIGGTRSLKLLRLGRHFRLTDSIKLIVGRNEKDNAELEGCTELYDIVLKLEGIPGPTGLLPCTAREEHVLISAAICARYGDCPAGKPVVVKVRSAREVRYVETVPGSPRDIEHLMV